MEEKVKPSFRDLIQNSPTPVLVDFHADWCGPCQIMAPVLHQLIETIDSKIKVVKVDVDKNSNVSNHYKIMGVPTFILFKKGEIVWRQSGVLPLSVLKKSLEPFL